MNDLTKVLTVLIFLLFSTPAFSQKNSQQKLVIVTFDGYRWKEVFQGADSALLRETIHGRKDSAYWMDQFWGKNEVERRQKLMPFIWNTFASQGQIYGNRNLKCYVNVKNPYWFSYPGYNEMFTGYPDPLINSNKYPGNPNVTVQEFISHQPGYLNKVAVFTSWVAFNNILNKQRSGLPINAGYTDFTGAHLSEAQQVISQAQHLLPKPMGPNERQDAITYFLAKEYCRQEHPSVLQISFIETDAFAHQGKYDQYLESARNDDAMLKDLWEYLQSDPFYRDQTTLYLVTDHGRGEGPAWVRHNSSTLGSDQVWFGVMGPQTLPLGEMKNQQVYQNQHAKTIAALLGLDFESPHQIGKVIEHVISKK